LSDKPHADAAGAMFDAAGSGIAWSRSRLQPARALNAEVPESRARKTRCAKKESRRPWEQIRRLRPKPLATFRVWSTSFAPPLPESTLCQPRSTRLGAPLVFRPGARCDFDPPFPLARSRPTSITLLHCRFPAVRSEPCSRSIPVTAVPLRWLRCSGDLCSPPGCYPEQFVASFTFPPEGSFLRILQNPFELFCSQNLLELSQYPPQRVWRQLKSN
jgi:hypothetical protein